MMSEQADHAGAAVLCVLSQGAPGCAESRFKCTEDETVSDDRHSCKGLPEAKVLFARRQSEIAPQASRKVR